MRDDTVATTWRPDELLGGPFESTPVGGGTLVRSATAPPRPRAVVLHLHGYNDYFFQDHFARALEAQGVALLGVDLPGAGRSLRADQIPHFVTDLREHGPALTAAVHAARAAAHGVPLVLHAHSTGGLLAALWAHAHRGRGDVDALALDSPFLDLHASWLQRTLGTWVLDAVGPWSPTAVLSTTPSVYATHQLATNGGRWDFDVRYKRPEGQPVRAGWLRAVRRGQARVARGLAIDVPVLVARSDRSGPDVATNPDLDVQDTVLDVAQIARLAPRLGDRVDTLTVPGGVHDLLLSREEPRLRYLTGLTGWIDDVVTGSKP
ncbi:alpha/beta fold hydrolase [Isoptericola sediminis]|uniref:Alpha/beta hydrolase n=1 Tax=Isoptericola sediminis TaxID=2733572 RepID=A0A849K9N6_9MICO|nr:alpha/beta hydrolase [Isoptericola sediminis]